ncbi:MAG: hypothetical protein LBM18_04680 [Oscillospiraceae bacterium]|jgi:hypothetical protein|nr:hypothetical protein [Oscillospiraceae bacterium]
MNGRQSQHFFLGGNTADGFYPLNERLTHMPQNSFFWVIKGGAGCGKSSFMRLIASAAEGAGFAVEYFACSGDPDSLDGIFIEELKTGYMDGTAPHIADVHLAAVDSSYLDIGRFYDLEGIEKHSSQLLKLNERIHEEYKKVYALLAAAGALKRGWLGALTDKDEAALAEKRLDGILRRELGTRLRRGGVISRRFLSAITWKGEYSFADTAKALCKRVYLFDSRLGLGALLLEKTAIAARDSGFKVIAAADPLTPEKLEAVFIPTLELGFSLTNSALTAGIPSRRIYLDAKGEGSARKEKKGELARCDKLVTTLKAEAIDALGQTKRLHDLIERIYNPFVDFEGMHKLVAEHLKQLAINS